MTPVRVGQRRVDAHGRVYVVGYRCNRYRRGAHYDGYALALLERDVRKHAIAPPDPPRVTAGPEWMRFDLGGAR